MRILLAIDSLNPGGAERQFSLLCRALVSRGLNVKVIALGTGLYADKIAEMGIDISVLQRRNTYDILPAASFARHIAEFEPDIIHCWGWMCTFSAYIPCLLKTTPLVSSIRTASKPKKRIRMWIQSLMADLVISNSVTALRTNNIRPTRGKVVYNGFDTDRIPAVAKNYPKFAIIMVARMSPKKDWHCFVDTARILRDSEICDHIQFIGIGDGHQYPKLLDYSRDLIHEDYLQLPGFSREPLQWICGADIGVLVSSPGVAEGTSNSILEYMACGLPVVCTRSGGNLETVSHGRTGLLVEPGNPEELADAIHKLYHNPALVRKMGYRGQKRLIERYSISTMAGDMLQAYRQLVHPCINIDV